jgi:hypothetical protein
MWGDVLPFVPERPEASSHATDRDSLRSNLSARPRHFRNVDSNQIMIFFLHLPSAPHCSAKPFDDLVVCSALLLQVSKEVKQTKANVSEGKDGLDGCFLHESAVDNECSGVIVVHVATDKAQEFDKHLRP